jgi:hypothetical protein
MRLKSISLSISEQDEIQRDLNFLIFEALASAYASRKTFNLIDLTTYNLAVRCQHEVLSEFYPDFYFNLENKFKIITNLAEDLHRETLRLIQENDLTRTKFLWHHSRVKRIHNLCQLLYENYSELTPIFLPPNSIYVMNTYQNNYYHDEFCKKLIF